MLLSGTLLLVLSMVFSTVSFAAPNLGRTSAGGASPSEITQVCACGDSACGGEVPGTWVEKGNGCKQCVLQDPPQCTSGEGLHCNTGSGAPVACPWWECTTNAQCNDANVCTDDTCGTDHTCSHTNNTSSCNDGDPCTVGDACSGGSCASGTDKDCSALDGQCVEGVCDPGSGNCEANNLPAATACSDDDPCTDPDLCNGAGVCAPGSDICGECDTNAQCSDSDICTTDACTSNACEHTPVASLSCYTGPAGTEGVGTCQPGTQSCSNSSWGACVGEVTPQTEICDGLDNDCDGVVDDGFDVGESCTVGIGECEATGTKVCTADHSGTECDATPGVPADEICIDKKDNDCDGSVDEGCSCNTGDTTSCGTTDVGECAYGTQTCVAGLWGICAGAIGPTAEICDGLDNDCDGSADEGLGTTTCGVGECQVSVDNCVDGKLQQCVPGTPGTEICGDNLDNDCDGRTDEGCGEPPDREEPSPTPQVPPPAPEPTVVVEVLGVEELPETGIPPLAPLLPTLPMTLSALALIASGLMLRETDKKN